MELNVSCSLSQTGYGIASLNILKELDGLGWDIAVVPKGKPFANTEAEAHLITKWMNKGKYFHHDAPHLNIWHQFDLGQTFGRGPKYAFPFFELNKFNDIEKHNLKYPDHIISSSKWAASVVADQVGSPSSIVPLGIDSALFSPASDKGGKGESPYRFLNIGKWEVRKGHDILVDIFNKAFTKKDNVELCLLTNNPFLNQNQTNEWISLYKKSGLGDKIKILPHIDTHNQLAQLIKSCDCAIFPSRAEGWNLEALECMACGLPVIITNYSAHKEFCNSFNSFLVEPNGLEDAYDGIWFHGDGQWASLDDNSVEQFAYLMRHCYEQRPTNLEGIETGKKFTWKNSAEQLAFALGSGVSPA